MEVRVWSRERPAVPPQQRRQRSAECLPARPTSQRVRSLPMLLFMPAPHLLGWCIGPDDAQESDVQWPAHDAAHDCSTLAAWCSACELCPWLQRQDHVTIGEAEWATPAACFLHQGTM